MGPDHLPARHLPWYFLLGRLVCGQLRLYYGLCLGFSSLAHRTRSLHVSSMPSLDPLSAGLAASVLSGYILYYSYIYSCFSTVHLALLLRSH
jgi:hypothetical protein